MADPRADVIKKALSDPKFKAELLENPSAAVEKATGAKIPAGVSIKVVEDGPAIVHLVLPVVSSAKGALSDAELTKVSGGYASGYTTPVCCENTYPAANCK